MYDQDGDGTISREEMGTIFSAISAMNAKIDANGNPVFDDSLESRVNEIFDKLDADGNGEISKEEFIQGAAEDNIIIEAFSLYDGFV